MNTESLPSLLCTHTHTNGHPCLTSLIKNVMPYHRGPKTAAHHSNKRKGHSQHDLEKRPIGVSGVADDLPRMQAIGLQVTVDQPA